MGHQRALRLLQLSCVALAKNSALLKVRPKTKPKELQAMPNNQKILKMDMMQKIPNSLRCIPRKQHPQCQANSKGTASLLSPWLPPDDFRKRIKMKNRPKRTLRAPKRNLFRKLPQAIFAW